MNLGFPAQERPARNVLTVAVSCAIRTRKHAASVTAYSVLRACPSIQCSTRSLHQQTTGNVENEKEPSPTVGDASSVDKSNQTWEEQVYKRLCLGKAPNLRPM